MKADSKRNDKIVGNNSKSYNDKHPDNPIHLRPIRQAIANVPKVKDDKGQLHPNYKAIREIRALGSMSWVGKQDLEHLARRGL